MYIIFSIPGGNNTEVDMVDSTQMEKFEFDKSNQTYLGKYSNSNNNSKNNNKNNNNNNNNNNNKNNNFDKSNQTYLGKKKQKQ